MTTPIVHLSRRYTFPASHRLYTDRLSWAENEAIFGKCANPNGHGHNYRLTVTVAGPVDPRTGFVMSLDQLDDAVRRHVLDVYDHRYLNVDVEDYFDVVPTGENIAKRIWERLEAPLTGRLRRIVLDETRNNQFEYTGPSHPT
jgi:6-pyruvoyltetrahydropterin/6-carboxytetrahydropterin synthase